MTYHFGLGSVSFFVASHRSADIECFVEDCGIKLITQQSFLRFGLFALSRPDDNDWQLLRYRHT